MSHDGFLEPCATSTFLMVSHKIGQTGLLMLPGITARANEVVEYNQSCIQGPEEGNNHLKALVECALRILSRWIVAIGQHSSSESSKANLGLTAFSTTLLSSTREISKFILTES